MKRLYFLAPNIKSTQSIVHELHEKGITDDDIHVVGKDHASLAKAHIHEAGLLETTDVTHAMHQGAKYGALVGFTGGILAAIFLPISLLFKFVTLIGLTMFGTAFGTWASSLVGISIPEPGVEKFQDDVDHGDLLMLVDVEVDREQEVMQLIRRHHPEARIGGSRLN